jgi:hypothetical protein
MAQEVTRHIRDAIQCLLWGRAAGRCEFAGCNDPLWKSPVTQEQVKLAELAHIYSFSDQGPRGNAGISEEMLNDIRNLILVCRSCHKTIDQDKEGIRYSAALLQEMKRLHERRVELATDIHPDMGSYVLHYGANIGGHSSPLKYSLTAPAMFPARYPADDKAIELATVNSSFTDRKSAFWDVEKQELISKFRYKVHDRLALGDISHLSIFALAPQPLLILLGSLLTDIPQADVYQLHREPQGWNWPNMGEVIPFMVTRPSRATGMPALVLSLSAPIASDRIKAVLGESVSIWTVRIAAPHNDFVKTREQLTSFRSLMRPLLDEIKVQHGQNTPLHIFPAVPVSLAVELGRVRMPKAHAPWRIYDQINELGGFIPALNIPEGVEDEQ